MKHFTIILALMLSGVLFGQTAKDRETAKEYAMDAIKLMDEKEDYAGAIELLEKAQKLDSSVISYPYEIAYSYYLLKEYDKAIKILEGLTTHKSVSDRVYQLLGNSWDIKEKPEKALEIYKEGLQKFPKSGKLYLESGIVEYFRENYNDAIAYWEKGIDVDPGFPSNYYWLTKIFTVTKEKIWTLLYGEMFMNLERGSKRTVEIGALMYSTYKDCYTKTDSGGEFNLTERGFKIKVDKKDLKKIKKGKNLLPFEGVYAMDYALAGVTYYLKDSINLDDMVSVRAALLKLWYNEKKHYKQFPNAVMVYQKIIEKNDFLDAYSYWLLMKGDEAMFDKWYETNKDKYGKFIEWYKENPMVITTKNKYSRLHYLE